MTIPAGLLSNFQPRLQGKLRNEKLTPAQKFAELKASKEANNALPREATYALPGGGLVEAYDRAKSGDYKGAVLPGLFGLLDAGTEGAASALKAGVGMMGRVDDIGDAARSVVSRIKKGDDFRIITAHNPNGQPASKAANAAANKALEKELKKRKIAYTRATGQYTDPETGKVLKEEGFVLTGAKDADVLELANKFQQNSVVGPMGLINRDGSVFPAVGASIGRKLSSPNKTIIYGPSGEKFEFAADIPDEVFGAGPIPFEEALQRTANNPPIAIDPKLSRRTAKERNAQDLPQARAIVRGTAESVEGAVPAPARGLISKPTAAGRTDQLPDPKVVRERLDEAERAIAHLERNRPDPWVREPRGLLDYSGFDPNYRMRMGEWTLASPAGQPNPVLSELLDNPRLRNLSERQAALGLDQGGSPFYNLEPIRRFADRLPDSDKVFNDFVGAGTAGSIQSSLPNELHNASILLFARENGLSLDEARRLYMEMYPNFEKPWVSSTHGQKWDEFQRTGTILPSSPTDGGRKIPTYLRDKLGEESPLAEIVADTHEQKNALYLSGAERFIDNMTGADYAEVTRRLHGPVADRMGIQRNQAQAGRWIGGGPLTGLHSPRGDYNQNVEDMMLYSAHRLGRPTTPAGLQGLLADVMQGKQMIPPYYGKGSPLSGLVK